MDALDVLRHHFDDPEINEIMINGPDDVFIAKPLSDETLKHGPLSNTLWMSWGKIKAIPEPEPSSFKNNAYFGLPWLGKESSVTEASSETFQLSTSPN